MDTLQVLKDMARRGNGDVYLGVVGPVRVGKSTFIKKFMETVVIENIATEEEKKRAQDELPQAGDGKTIMTMEPKFVPSNGVSISLDDKLKVKVRLIDCVGFVIDAANGYLEDHKMRMVKTPWFNDPIPFDDAARIGTQKVIKDHSTVGIVIFSDGSINDFKRVDYLEAEEKVITEMKAINKPFVIVLNTKTPGAADTHQLKKDLMDKYGVPVIPINVASMRKTDATEVMKEALYQFPIAGIEMSLPDWVKNLDEEHYLKQSIKQSLDKGLKEARIVKDVDIITVSLKENEYVEKVQIQNIDTGTGLVTVQMDIKESLYDQVLKELVGCEISDKSQLISILSEFVRAKRDYDLIGQALKMAEATGYGFATSPLEKIKIEKPELTKSTTRYGIKVRASTPTYHIIKVDVNTSFDPILGSKDQAEYFVKYLTEAFEKNPMEMMNCEIFGRKFKDVITEGITIKLNNLPEPIKIKLQQLIKTISNKGKSNLIAFVF